MTAPRPWEVLVLKRPLRRPGPLGLEDAQGYRLLYFARPEQLLSAAERRMGDAILAHLEDVGEHDEALGLCKRVKAHERARDLPLILHGRFPDKDRATDLLRAGADELLPDEVEPDYGRARLEVWLRAKSRLDDLTRAKRRIEESVEADLLTQVGNRAAFDRWLAEVPFGDRRRDRSISLLLIDVDCFKPINDRLGHRFGDYVLQEVAALLRARLRGTDRIARYGGDEFAVLAEGSDARVLARSLVRTVREHRFEREGRRAEVTLSIGVADSAFPAIGSGAQLLEAADRALYRAKETGRDRAEVYRGAGAARVLDVRDLDALQTRSVNEPSGAHAR